MAKALTWDIPRSCYGLSVKFQIPSQMPVHLIREISHVVTFSFRVREALEPKALAGRVLLEPLYR